MTGRHGAWAAQRPKAALRPRQGLRIMLITQTGMLSEP